ncbi:hypothetical protein [Streptomyces sp. S1]|uniref:hypothetical protein n=1 Tax=Streptomyces sp. S1 TaxID=718288 RepID=UPI000EF7E3C3|nr:hypothetical protein [Streptomyces sp. S1]
MRRVVEAICGVLCAHDCGITPTSCYAHHERRAVPSARAVRDAEPKERISRDSETDCLVCGTRRIWRSRADRATRWPAAPPRRRAAERTMRALGITDASAAGA